MAAMVYFDTHQYVKTLEQVGFTEKQAETFAKVQQASLSQCLDTSLASKQDVMDLKLEMKTLESKVNTHGYMLGVIIAGISALILKAFF
jgi:hypothetical protein